MKSILRLPLSADRLWFFSFVSIAAYLLLYPSLVYGQSYAVALGGGLVLLLFRSVAPGSFSILGIPWVGFILYVLLSSFWSLVPGLTLQSAGFLFLGTLLYLMARSNDLKIQSRLEIAGLGMAVLVALTAIEEWFFGFDRLTLLLPSLSRGEFQIVEKGIFYGRASGVLATSGSLAALMILFIPLGLVLTGIYTGFKKWIFCFSTLILFGGLLTAQSVGGWASLILALLWVLLKRQSKAWSWMVLVLGVMVLIGVVLGRGAEHWSIASLNMRYLLWQSAWKLFLEHPFLGSGLGTFGEAYQRAGFSLVQGGARFAHNLFFQLLVETGLAGFSLFSISLIGFYKRFKTPAQWNGWGTGTGILAFLLLSLIDIPFQMPELIWVFAGILGSLELKPVRTVRLPALSVSWVEYSLLATLLLSGFWASPLHLRNLFILAVFTWTSLALFQRRFEKLPLWFFAGGMFIVLRAFFSPSASGATWFLETCGILLAFGLLLRSFKEPFVFLKRFCGLGIFWALAVWWFSFHYSDIKDWKIFPNPKHVGVFLLSFFFLQVTKPLDFRNISPALMKNHRGVKNFLLLIFSIATLFCLKAYGAMVGLTVGFSTLMKRRQHLWSVGLAGLVISLILVFRVMAFHSLDKSPTLWDRLFIWKSAVAIWSQEPLEGVGPGAFGGLFQLVKSPRTSGVSRYLMDAPAAHNEFLELLTDFGIVGFVWGFFLIKSLWPSKNIGRTSALTALGTASFFDFCLHTPFVALQGIGLLTSTEEKATAASWPAGFLAGGIALGLFVPAVFVPMLQRQSDGLKADGKWQAAYCCLENAERLNAWDARIVAAKADFLEEAYRQTRDGNRKKGSDEAFDQALDLEKVEGRFVFEKAQRLTRRLEIANAPGDIQKAREAWIQARAALPLNAFVFFQEGWFFLGQKEKDGALADFQKVTELEPNYAKAWVNLGNLLQEKRELKEARADHLKALEVYNRWKDADRIDPIEKEMVSLPPPVLTFLQKEVGP